jgi:hypothetical protein
MKVIISCEYDVDEDTVAGYRDDDMTEEEAVMQACQDEIGHTGITVMSADV